MTLGRQVSLRIAPFSRDKSEGAPGLGHLGFFWFSALFISHGVGLGVGLETGSMTFLGLLPSFLH